MHLIKGYNRLTKGIDYTEIIPTRMPRAGELTHRVSLQEALEIADRFYEAHTIENLEKGRIRTRKKRGK